MNATLTDGSGRSSRVKHDNTNRAIGVGVCQKNFNRAGQTQMEIIKRSRYWLKTNSTNCSGAIF